MSSIKPKLVSFYRERGTGRNRRGSFQNALIVDDDAKRLKLIIQDAPMVLTWVSKSELENMRDVMVGQRLVIDRDENGKETGRHKEGGRPYNFTKARIAFRAQWLQFNEGTVPHELRPMKHEEETEA